MCCVMGRLGPVRGWLCHLVCWHRARHTKCIICTTLDFYANWPIAGFALRSVPRWRSSLVVGEWPRAHHASCGRQTGVTSCMAPLHSALAVYPHLSLPTLLCYSMIELDIVQIATCDTAPPRRSPRARLALVRHRGTGTRQRCAAKRPDNDMARVCACTEADIDRCCCGCPY